MLLSEMQVFYYLSIFKTYPLVAKHMGMSASNIRRKIIKLEKALQLQLIVVYQKQILLTEEGQNFIKFCKKVVDAGEQGYTYVNNIKRHPKGDLSVLMDSESLFKFIKSHELIFIKKYPEININLAYRVQNSFAQERPNDLLLTTHSKYKYPNAYMTCLVFLRN